MLKELRIFLLAGLARLGLKLLYASYRLQGLEAPAASEAAAGERAVILAFWHNRQLAMPWIHSLFRGKPGWRPVAMLMSEHSDGRIAAAAAKPFGIEAACGSSSKGGHRGLLGPSAALEDGKHAGITPDGPRGPLYESKPGAVKLAQLSGAPIIPVAYGTGACWRFKSWDRMMLPKPFAWIFPVFGEPIWVPPELSAEEEEAWRRKLDEALCAVTDRADRLAGMPPTASQGQDSML